MMYLGDKAVGLATRTGNMASGEFTLDAPAGSITITHNLGSNRVFVVAQRVNSDHSNINNSNRYQNVLFYGITIEALGIDEEQTYSYNNGNQVSYNSKGTLDNSFPFGIYSYFSTETGTTPTQQILSNANWFAGYNKMITSINQNEIFVVPRYQLCPGRWIWRAYALD